VRRSRDRTSTMGDELRKSAPVVTAPERPNTAPREVLES
jgi:hypothetical protein